MPDRPDSLPPDSAPELASNPPADWHIPRPQLSDMIVGGIRTGLPLLLWGALLTWLVWRVPMVMHVFEDFGVEMTFPNRLLFHISRIGNRTWPLLSLLVAGLGYVSWLLERQSFRQQRPQRAWSWFLLMSTLPLLIWIFAEFALVSQLHLLMNELAPR